MGPQPPPEEVTELQQVQIAEQGVEGSSDAGTAVPVTQEASSTALQLTSLTAPNNLDLLKDPIIAEAKDQMERAERGQVFTIADAAAKRYMLERVVAQLPPEQQEAARMVIETVNFGKVGKGESERKPFIRLSMIHQQISRMLIMEMLKNAEMHDFNPLEAQELQAGISLADATDDMYIDWEFRQHAIAAPQERTKAGFTSPWHIVSEGVRSDKSTPPQYAETSYRYIYPQEYDIMGSTLNGLLSRLKAMQATFETGSEIEGITEELLASKMAYYTALRDAYAETDKAKLPDAWLKVDRAFVHQGGNVRAVHPMETGYANNQTGMIPQQSMRYFLPEHPANEAINQKKETLINMLSRYFRNRPEIAASADVIRMLDARVAYYAVRSGFEIVFKFVGHNIPNDRNIREKDGVNTFIDPGTMAERLGEGEALFRKFFDQDQHDCLKDISVDAVLEEVAVHEFGHNIGDGSGLRKINPGAVRSVEEWKATATTYVMQVFTNPAELSDEALRGNFLSFLCQTMRYTQRRDEGSQSSYYNADRFFMQMAQECGLIVKGEDNKWRLDLSRANLDKYMQKVSSQWLGLQDIYKDNDEGGLEQFVAEHIVDTPFIKDLKVFIDADKQAA